MGFFSDVLKFEAFNAKDMFGKFKDDPERALLGAVDPASSALWGGILGKDYEPIVDQMGGAYGGSPISMGNSTGGVYGRAQEAGINTGPGGGMHDLAHVIAAMYATNGIAGIGGAPAAAGGGAAGAGAAGWGGAGTANSGLGVFANNGVGGMAGVGGGNAGALAASGGLSGTGAGAYGMNPQTTQNLTKAGQMMKDSMGGGEGGGGGGILGQNVPMSTPQGMEQADSRTPLNQTQTRLRGFGRTPIKFRGQVIWV